MLLGLNVNKEDAEICFELSYEVDYDTFCIEIKKDGITGIKFKIDQEEFEDLSRQMIRLLQQANLRKAHDFTERQKQILEINQVDITESKDLRLEGIPQEPENA